AILFSLVQGTLKGTSTGNGGDVRSMQQNTVEDIAQTTPTVTNGTVVPTAVATAAIKRFDTKTPLTIDSGKSYQATIKTTQGNIQLQLDAKAAPQTVNSFVFLAKQGYYNNTQFMQVVANADGSKFTAQAGDPTATGLGSPGYFIPKETTTGAFSKGAVGMGGSANNSNGGQFFISYGDYPPLTNK